LSADVIRLHVFRWRFIAIGGGCLVLAAFCLSFLIAAIVTNKPFEFATFLAFAGSFFLGWLGVVICGLGINRPVGLRIDAKGLSGWYVPAVTWDEVNYISTRKVKGNLQMLIHLHDFNAVVARQPKKTRVGRQILACLGQRYLAVPLSALEDAEPQEILEIMGRYKPIAS